MVRLPQKRVALRGASDVVVAGGGIAGVAAALSASRAGASVILVEKTISFGGLATLGNVIMYLPICDGKGHQVIGGIGEELLHLAARSTGGARAGRRASASKIPGCWLKPCSEEERSHARYAVEFNAASLILALEQLLVDSGVVIRYDTRLIDVKTEDRRITEVIVGDKSGLGAYRAGMFVDATGDADLAFFSGEEIVSVGANVPCGWFYHTADGVLEIDRLTTRYETDPDVVPEDGIGFACTDAESVTEHVLASRRLIRSRIERLEDQGATASIVPVALPQVATFRMTRRLRGKAEPSTADALEGNELTIGMTGDWRRPGPVYHLPYGSLFGRTENLLVAGRCISVHNDLWDATRAIPTCVLTGEASGVAAVCALESKRSVESTRVEAIRKRLIEQGALL